MGEWEQSGWKENSLFDDIRRDKNIRIVREQNPLKKIVTRPSAYTYAPLEWSPSQLHKFHQGSILFARNKQETVVHRYWIHGAIRFREKSP